jgi:hypothetical protein
MSKPKNITQKTFQPHLLVALGELTNFTAGKSVRFTETYAPVCKLMGISEDEYGTCETHDKPWTHRLIGLCFRSLRDKGLGEYEKKGYWALTKMGEQKAREEAGVEAVVEETVEEAVVEEVVSPAPVHTAARTQVAESNEGSVVRLPTVHPYHADPYIRSLAIAATGCFGSHSTRSETCKTCPLSGDCHNAVLAQKSKIAADMEATDRRMAAAREAKAQKKAAKDESIDELISGFDEVSTRKAKGKTKAKKKSKATAQRDGVCCVCNGKISKGDDCYWSKGDGIFHLTCDT